MLRYILKRLLLLIPTLIGISLIVLLLIDLTPGDPARSLLGAAATEEQVEELREELGLNDPFFCSVLALCFSCYSWGFWYLHHDKPSRIH